MGQVAKRVEDKRLLKLIRAFLNAGVMENGLVSPSVEGTPQGGPLSPLLSNLVLDELDRELERRGHRYLRYADDCNIYAGRRGNSKRREHTIPSRANAYAAMYRACVSLIPEQSRFTEMG
jgi:RNA-directed DNA polymerase